MRPQWERGRNTVRSSTLTSTARPRRKILWPDLFVSALAYGCVLVVISALLQFTLSR